MREVLVALIVLVVSGIARKGAVRSIITPPLGESWRNLEKVERIEKVGEGWRRIITIVLQILLTRLVLPRVLSDGCQRLEADQSCWW